MGITIHYRGTIKDINDAVTLEKQLMALARSVGIDARIWWSQSEKQPGRVVRGALFNVAPNVEIASFLVSPEGWLLPSVSIEDSENDTIKEPPWVAVKTQFGPVEAHVAVVEILRALKDNFFPDLEVHDEGEYWETRRISRLLSRMNQLKMAMDKLMEALEPHVSEIVDDSDTDDDYDEDAQIQRLILLAKHAQSQLRRPSSDCFLPDPRLQAQ